MSFLSNINANEFTTTAFIVGILLCENLNANEQNAIGNWFELLGQVLETNSAQEQVIQSSSANAQKVDIENLKKAINIINNKINNL